MRKGLSKEQNQKLDEMAIKMKIQNLNSKERTHKLCQIGGLCLKYAKVDEPSDLFLEKLEAYLKYNEEKGNWFSSWFKNKK